MSAPPPFSYANWQALGLSRSRQWAYVDNYQGRGPAVVGWQRAPDAGGITAPGVHWWACDEQWAPATRENPALPWPPFWSLGLFREVAERRSSGILGDLDGVRRRAPGIVANTKIRQVGPDVGARKPMPCTCTHPDCEKCGKVQSMRADAAGRGVGLSCCFSAGPSAEQMARGSRTIARRHGVQHIAEMTVEVPWLVPLFGPDDYTNNRTHLPYRCLRCGGVHQIQPVAAIQGSAACGSSRAQPMANGRDPAEVGQMGAAVQPVEAKRAGGLATGGRDDIFLRAQGLGRPLNGPCSYYLTTVPGHPELVKPGIASDCERRARQHNYCGGADFHAEWVRPTRDEAAAIESIRLRATAHLAECPPGMEGKNGAWEIRRLSLEAEIAEVELLVNALNEGMSPWELALAFMPDLTSAERAILEGAMS